MTAALDLISKAEESQRKKKFYLEVDIKQDEEREVVRNGKISFLIFNQTEI